MAADIFLSYDREDRERAAALARLLATEGLSVWWDRNIPPGKSFDTVIEEALTAARCVVVLWSEKSVVSGWVKAEAQEGLRRRILVPAFLDEGVRLPLGFRQSRLPISPGIWHMASPSLMRGSLRFMAY